MPAQNASRNTTRRQVLAATGFVPLATLLASAQAPQTSLAPQQKSTLEALLNRLCPKDESGPGAVECGAANYIDRVLAGPNASEKRAFTDGLAALDSAAQGSFAALTGDQQDAIITAFENGTAPGFANARAFFNRARRLMLEGMFSDPYYGGNRNFAGWDLIQYPGPRLAVAPEDQKMDAAPKPHRVSAWGGPNGH
jgi:hypothetical protein